MRFSFGHIVEHPDFVLAGRILFVDEGKQGYIIEDLYNGTKRFYDDKDEALQPHPDQGYMTILDS